MTFIKAALVILSLSLAFAFAALNGFLGVKAQSTMEDIVLGLLGESRGSYFLKNMTPLKDTPISKQTGQLVDQGQAAYSSGRKTGEGLNSRVTDTLNGL